VALASLKVSGNTGSDAHRILEGLTFSFGILGFMVNIDQIMIEDCLQLQRIIARCESAVYVYISPCKCEGYFC